MSTFYRGFLLWSFSKHMQKRRRRPFELWKKSTAATRADAISFGANVLTFDEIFT